MTWTVLFVDDDTLLLNALQRSLKKEPFSILTAPDAHGAIEVLNQNDVDVVVSDERMPGISGVEFLSQIQHLFPGTMRIVLSGHTDPAVLLKAVNEGNIFRFLTKPCSSDVLATAIHQAIEQKQLMDRGREAVWVMQRQAILIRRLRERHPAALADALNTAAGVQLKPQDFTNAEELAQEMSVQISTFTDLYPALTKKG